MKIKSIFATYRYVSQNNVVSLSEDKLHLGINYTFDKEEYKLDIDMNGNILEFVTFTIGSVAERLHKSPAEVYRLFKQANVIAGYLVPAYDILHTFGRQYLVDDVLDFMQEKGVKPC